MNCFDDSPDLKGKSKDEIIRILAKERNSFAKSRKEWRIAAFSLLRGERSEFDRLVSKELCTNCLNHYEKI
jgi:uncharacterized protein YdcH (DUF465 family)